MNLKNFPVDSQICQLLIGSCKKIKRKKHANAISLVLVANSESDIRYGWRLGNNKSVNFDTKVLLSQFDLIQYPQYDEIENMNGRMSCMNTHTFSVFLSCESFRKFLHSSCGFCSQTTHGLLSSSSLCSEFDVSHAFLGIIFYSS